MLNLLGNEFTERSVIPLTDSIDLQRSHSKVLNSALINLKIGSLKVEEHVIRDLACKGFTRSRSLRYMHINSPVWIGADAYGFIPGKFVPKVLTGSAEYDQLYDTRHLLELMCQSIEA